MQSNVFTWKFGELDGAGIDWNQFRFYAWFEVAAYMAVIALIIRCRKFFAAYTVHIAGILIASQIATLIPQENFQVTIRDTFRQSVSGDLASYKNYEYTLDGFCDYSKEGNVVVMILDALGTRVFERIIDDEPTCKDSFADFTQFKNCFVHDPAGTKYSVPRILTGCNTDGHPWSYVNYFSNAYNREHTLLKTLSRNGYECKVLTSAANTVKWDENYIANIRPLKNVTSPDSKVSAVNQLVTLTLFRIVPTHVKPYCYDKLNHSNVSSNDNAAVVSESNDSGFRPLNKSLADYEFYQFIKDASWSSGANTKQVRFIHLSGAHAPYTMNENCEPEDIKTLDGEIRQGKGALKIASEFIEKMKASGVYDNSLIVVLSDHGPFRGMIDYYIDESSMNRPLLMVKCPQTHQPELQTNNSPVHLKDTTPAILTKLGIERPLDAFSWFDMPPLLAAERNKEWTTFWNRKQAHSQALSFDGKSDKLATEIKLQRKHILLSNNTVHIEIAGDATDVVGENKFKTLTLALVKTGERNTCANVIVPIEYKNTKTDRGNCWVVNTDIKFNNTPDGEYELVVMLPANKLYAKLGRTVTVANGIAKTVNKITTENIAAHDGGVVR
jgi:hypothetical protein